jgi:type I restriction-modification system DNA methylase subunit
MLNKNLPIPRALQALYDLYQKQSRSLYLCTTKALIWIAIARLHSAGKFSSNFSLNELFDEAGWESVVRAGMSTDAILLLRDSFTLEVQKNVCAQSVAIIKELGQELAGAPNSAWDVLPYLFQDETRNSILPELFIAQPVIECMLDKLGDETGSVWTPFDSTGQIAISAVRRGFTVSAASIEGPPNLLLQILICIETANHTHEKINTEISRDPFGRPTTTADFVIATPQMGMSVKSGSWAQWHTNNDIGIAPFDRSETWAVYELIRRANKRLVVLTSTGLLFGTGQEKKLREYLIEQPSPLLESVTTLPKGALALTNTQSAIVSFNIAGSVNGVQMTDLVFEKPADSFYELIESHRNGSLGKKIESKNTRLVSFQEIRDAEYVFFPQRLIRKAALASSNSVSLGEICVAIRPTTPYKGSDADIAIELGIPNLREREWNPIPNRDESPYPIQDKDAYINPRTRQEYFLQKDDLILSVKGTIGLARLVSSFYGVHELSSKGEEWIKSVVSTSCVALRLDEKADTKGVTAVFLLMYLRSVEGQEQISALKVGTGMPHISVQSLMSSVRIPVPSVSEIADVMNDWIKLCKLEDEIQSIQFDIRHITESRWFPIDVNQNI